MSQYINFFVKGIDSFYPIASYSRADEIYQRFDGHVPYGSVAPVCELTISRVKHEIDRELETIKEDIDSNKIFLSELREWKNSMDEKMDQYMIIQSNFHELNEQAEDLRRARMFADFLYGIMEEADNTKYNDEIETLDSAHYIYAGIECEYPDIEDYR